MTIGFIVAQSEKALGFVPCVGGDFAKPESKVLWTPRVKVVSCKEFDLPSRNVKIESEPMPRVGIPVNLSIDHDFLAKVKREDLK
jgi:hypothetical protein